MKFSFSTEIYLIFELIMTPPVYIVYLFNVNNMQAVAWSANERSIICFLVNVFGIYVHDEFFVIQFSPILKSATGGKRLIASYIPQKDA